MKRKMHFNAKPGVFYHARLLRKNPTPAEEKLWAYLRNKQTGYKFRRQHPMDKFAVDFFCRSLKLVIEVEGGIHEDAEQVLKDKEKENVLISFGLNIIRFSNEQVMFDINEVMNTIYSKI